jgi:hypothetical protein
MHEPNLIPLALRFVADKIEPLQTANNDMRYAMTQARLKGATDQQIAEAAKVNVADVVKRIGDADGRQEVAVEPPTIDTVVVDQDGDTWEFGQAVGMWRCTSQDDEEPLHWDDLRAEYGPLALQEKDSGS